MTGKNIILRSNFTKPDHNTKLFVSTHKMRFQYAQIGWQCINLLRAFTTAKKNNITFSQQFNSKKVLKSPTRIYGAEHSFIIQTSSVQSMMLAIFCRVIVCEGYITTHCLSQFRRKYYKTVFKDEKAKTQNYLSI